MINTMNSLILPAFAMMAVAHSEDTASSTSLSSLPNSTLTSTIPAPSMSNNSNSSSSSDTSPPYTITALPAIRSASPCVFNCLIPIGLADPSGCDDVTNDCACLSAPADVLDALTECANTVCQSSTSEYGASATSLFQSYCKSLYGTMTISQAFVAEASAAAASNASMSENEGASMTASASITAAVGESATSGSPSASAKSSSGSLVEVDLAM